MGNKWDDFARDKDPEYWSYNRAIIADSSLSDKEKIRRIEALDDGTESGKKELDEGDLSEAESDTAEVTETGVSEKAETERINVDQEDYYKGSAGNYLRKSRNRRRMMKVALLLMFPLIGLFTMIIFSGPLKLIHIGKMFQKFHFASNETSQNSRVGRIIEFVRTSGPEGDKSKRNLGLIATALSTKHQNDLGKKGITIGYDNPVNPDGSPSGKSSRMQNLIINTNTPEGRRTLDALRNEGFKIDPPDGNGNSNVPFRGESARLRRRALNITVDAQGKSKIATIVSKRLLRVRAGVDFHPLKNISRAANEKFQDFKAKRKAERAEKHRTGIDPTGGRTASGAPKLDEAGNPIDDPPSNNTAGGTNDLANDAKKANTPELKKGMLSRLTGGTAAAIGVLCIVKDVGEEIPKYQHANTVLPLVRTGMEFVAISSQIQSFTMGAGPMPSLDEMRALSEEVDYIDEQDSANNSFFMNAETIEKQNGVAEGGEPLPEDVGVMANSTAEKPWLFDIVDDIPVLGSVCGAIDSGMRFLKKIPIIGSVVNAYEQAQEYLINVGLSAAGTDMNKIMAAVIRFFASDTVNVAGAVGAELGGLADLGVFLGEKEHAIGMGGGELTAPELVAINTEYRADMYKEQSEKTMFARVFNVLDTDSLAAQTIIQNPQVATALSDPVSSVASVIGSSFTKFGSFGQLFTGKAKAADPIPVDYGVAPSGFSLETLEDERFEDPYANAEIVERELESLNSEYGGCFGTTVDPTTFALKIGASIDYSEENGINQDQCKNGSEELLRYRMYILDTVSLRSMACYEGLDDEACREIGIDVSGSTVVNPGPATPTTVTAPGLNGYSIPCAGIPATPFSVGTRPDAVNWSAIPDSGTIGTTSGGQPIKVYIREACTQTNVKTVVIGSSIHGTENYGQPISFELLFKKTLPQNMRVIAIPEINGAGLIPPAVGRINANGVNLNRNFNYRWNEMSGAELNSSTTNYRGTAPESEPESKALTSFLTSISATTSLFIVYHDDENYVGGAHNTSPAIATKYLSTLRTGGVTMPHGNEFGQNIKQKGSLDGWFNEATTKPALLVEMPASASATVLSTHADAIISLVQDGAI